MKFDQRQAMRDMIEFAAKDQQKQLEWIGNLFRQRLKNLQETKVKYQEWVESSEKTKEDQNDAH